MKQFNKLLFLMTFVFLSVWGKALAQAPSLGTAGNFVLFSNVGPVSNSGSSQITGDVGTNVGSTTGFNNINGTVHDHDATSVLAAAAVLVAYTQLDTLMADDTLSSSLGGGSTLMPGVYTVLSGAVLNGNLNLDADGNSNALFIIKIQGSLNAASASKVVLRNGAQACNVYWKTEDTLAMAPRATMMGTVIVNNGPIILSANDTLEGRALTTTGGITVNRLAASIPMGCGMAALIGPAAPVMNIVGCFALFAAAVQLQIRALPR